ncbi:type II toxin-antitoxin system HipA family toxin [Rhizohabitans arisaemae]|uniref:type II toxin-antitoxin system HipA family toxin n=1 Tax=Rhizohabitans arisaemae TaxID=2720610 RepID=UPI0024B20A19|nr:type II toxin-antitoxin system HipA family toxin [Rhizohabitans arisaemae]
MGSRSVTAGVYLSNRRVGTLGYLDGNTWFDYEDREPGHPVLGQAFEAEPNRRRTASGALPAWFANLLPEAGSGLRQIVGRELGRNNPHDFQVMTYLGDDLPGAVRVVPDSDLGEISGLSERQPEIGGQIVRFSLAGVQAKFSMSWEGKGLVLPASGRGGDWIVKLPDRRFPDVPANEFAMLQWARHAGIEVPELELINGSMLKGLPENLIAHDEYALAIKRFDRTPGGRVHQEDFAQVREASVESKYDRATYSGLARFLKVVCPQDIAEYVRRLATMVVIGNLDAHLKNWTLRYPDGRTTRLSPAYDFVSVSAYPEFRNDELAFALDGGRVARNITMDHFRSFARRAYLDVDEVVPIVSRTVGILAETWQQVARDCPVPDFVRQHIDQRIASLPLIREARPTSD